MNKDLTPKPPLKGREKIPNFGEPAEGMNSKCQDVPN